MANNKTRGVIFSVNTTEERSEEQWSKISWCYMTRGSGKGARWKVLKTSTPRPRKLKRSGKKKKKRKVFLEVVDVHDVPVCTWVKTKDLPLMVKAAMVDGAVTSRGLSSMNQSNRALIVPFLCHPLTMAKPLGTSVTSFFTSVINTEEGSSPVRQAVSICWEDFNGDIKIKHYDTVNKKGLRVCP